MFMLFEFCHFVMGDMASRSVHITKSGFVLISVFALTVVYVCCRRSLNYWSGAKVDMHRLLAVCLDVARLGGGRVKSVYRELSVLQPVVKGKTQEGAKELLTRGDMESHRAMRYALESNFPGIRLVSEEHDNNPGGAHDQLAFDPTDYRQLELLTPAGSVDMRDITVWIDPLDATQEYTEDLVHYVTNMVCVAVSGVPIIGIIYRPFTNEVAWGYVGHGVSSNVKRWTEEAKSLSAQRNGTKVIVSRSHAGDVSGVVRASLGEHAQVEPAGGAGYKVLRVINGSVDAYVHTTRIKKWDICAGNAILNAANGIMTTLTGEKINYSDTDDPRNNDGLLATLHAVDHSKFLAVFAKEFRKQKSSS